MSDDELLYEINEQLRQVNRGLTIITFALCFIAALLGSVAWKLGFW